MEVWRKGVNLTSDELRSDPKMKGLGRSSWVVDIGQ